jgi:hypothetical protein
MFLLIKYQAFWWQNTFVLVKLKVYFQKQVVGSIVSVFQMLYKFSLYSFCQDVAMLRSRLHKGVSLRCPIGCSIIALLGYTISFIFKAYYLDLPIAGFFLNIPLLVSLSLTKTSWMRKSESFPTILQSKPIRTTWVGLP